MSNMSEDALFKALLKNKPPQTAQKPQVPVKKEVVKPPAPKVEVYEKEAVYEKPAPVVETRITPTVPPLQNDQVLDSIKNLNASVNMVHGLMKTVLLPVLVLILIIGVAILAKMK